MKKGIRILYFVTVVISALVGLWHFFVPWMFQWYDYLPMQYENLIEPWPLQPIPAAAIGQLVASDALAIMMVVVSVCFIKELRRK